MGDGTELGLDWLDVVGALEEDVHVLDDPVLDFLLDPLLAQIGQTWLFVLLLGR